MSGDYYQAIFNCRTAFLESIGELVDPDEVLMACANLKILLTEFELLNRYKKEG